MLCPNCKTGTLGKKCINPMCKRSLSPSEMSLTSCPGCGFKLEVVCSNISCMLEHIVKT